VVGIPLVWSSRIGRGDRDHAGRSTMSLLDKIKGLIRGNRKTIKEGVDEVDKFAKDKLPSSADGKVDDVAKEVKKQVDKI
jgi:imidazolonepropionase-like amidohydrolase